MFQLLVTKFCITKFRYAFLKNVLYGVYHIYKHYLTTTFTSFTLASRSCIVVVTFMLSSSISTEIMSDGSVRTLAQLYQRKFSSP